jgi:PKD repeat protein
MSAALLTLVVAASPALAPAVAAADPNVAPSVTATVSNAKPEEPQTVFASATFTDPESASETYTCSILYGDGTALVAGTISGLTCTGPVHRYLVTGSYVILVTVTDSGGASGAWMTGVNYTNDAPYIGGGVAMFGAHDAGHIAYAAAPFWDYGSAYFGTAFETYSCTFDYGDGSGVQAGTYIPIWDYDGYPACIGPNHVYQAAGNYAVTAVVKDSGGASSSATSTIKISPPSSPSVIPPADQNVSSAQAAAYHGSYPYSLGSFTDPDGASAGPWQWTVAWAPGYSWSGTATSQGPLIVSRPLMPGTYRAHIVVTDASGWSGDAYFNVTVAGDTFIEMAPVVVATEGVPTSLQFGYFDPYAAGPWAIHIDWGDGTSKDLSNSNGANMDVAHTYAASDPTPGHPGGTVYTATVTVTDSLGHTGSGSRPEPVIDLAPVVTASPVNVPEGFSGQVTLATFTDASVGPWHVRIDGGPGLQSDEDVAAPGPIQVPYDTTFGSHTFTVSVGDRGGLITTVTVPVTVVNGAPSVGPINIDGDVTNGQPREGGSVAVDAAFTDPGGIDAAETFTCTVDYGDGAGPVAGELDPGICYGPVHTYGTSGSGTIRIAVTDSNGATGSSALPYTLVNVAPIVSAFMSDYNPREWHLDPTVPSSVNAYATFTDPGSTSETYTCSVDYGDGTVVPGVVSGLTCTGPLHQYLVSASYTVTVSVRDSQGSTGTGLTGATYENWAPWVGGSLVGPYVVGAVLKDVAAVDDPGRAFETYTCTVDYGDGSGVQAGTYVPDGWSDGLPRCVGPDHVYKAPGTYSITTTATDSAGETGSSLAIETIAAPAITVFPVSAPGSVDEGSAGSASAPFNPSGLAETYTCTVDYGDGAGPVAGTLTGTDPGSICQGPTHLFARSGTFTITVKVKGSSGLSGSASTSISVANVPPVINTMSMGSLAGVGTTVKVKATFSDPGAGESYKATWTWGDGKTTTASLGSSSGSFSASHTYVKAGSFEVHLTVSDGSGSSVASRSLVVYDPARTLSGSGSVASPTGACRMTTRCGVASTATFLVSAKYGKAATPTVSASFAARDFSFVATSAEWFVAANGTAMIQGAGKVNGMSGYRFFLVVVDGRPDAIQLTVFDSASNTAYGIGSSTLRSGFITIR